jgi:predicted nucleotidyltransferase
VDFGAHALATPARNEVGVAAARDVDAGGQRERLVIGQISPRAVDDQAGRVETDASPPKNSSGIVYVRQACGEGAARPVRRTAGDLAFVPESGTIIPEMGTARRKPGVSAVASALFTPVQQRVLGLLFGQPDRRFQSAELIRLARGGTGAVHRQLQRLANAGLVTVSHEGNQKYYTARKDAPVFPELHGLITKTVGIVEPLGAALRPIAKQIELAFVFGSVAKGNERAASDLDLLIISDTITYPEAYEALQEAERAIGRTVNPTVMTPAEWHRKRKAADSFAKRIATQPKLFVIGDEHALG